jgi:D-sedoheptulose 7-phosphate isomerase
MDIATVGLTGQGGGKMVALSDIIIAVPNNHTNHVQEAHISIGHPICAIVEERLCSPKL